MHSQARFWTIITSRLFQIIAIVAMIIIVVAIVKNQMRKVELTQEINSLQAKINSFEQKNKELSNLISYFQTNEFREREARLRLNLQKPGEQVVIIPQNGESSVLGEQTSGGAGYQANNWQKWWNHFFKL
ncbi:MAG: septum formation initiator family protein [Patescibacteria group bacterium]